MDDVGFVKKNMYAAVDAHAKWFTEASKLAQGLCNPSLFFCQNCDVRLLVHGEAFWVDTTTQHV